MRASLLPVLAMLLAACAAGAPELPPDDSAVAAHAAGGPRLAADAFVTADGATLPLRRWLPAGAPAAIVLALHGFNDYSNGFADAGAAFARAGIATYAYDQRGFGRAPGRGRWAGTGPLAGDAVTALALLRRRYPGTPAYLLGESMGGAVAILAAADGAARPDGLILVAPAVWGRQTMNLFERAGLWLANLAPGVRWSPDLLPVKVLASDNIPMLRAFVADPLVIKATRAGAIAGLVDLMDAALTAAPRLRSTALILYGEHDQIVPRAPVARFVAGLPPAAAPRQTVALYPAGYHMLMRDLDGALVIGDVIAWIGDRRAALPSGAERAARQRLIGAPAPLATAQPAPVRTGPAAAIMPGWPRASS